MAHPIAAPTPHKSPSVNLKFNNKSIFPLVIIPITPVTHKSKPIILDILILSLKNRTEIKNSIKSHVYDGAALAKFIFWLQNSFKSKKKQF